MVDFRWMRAIDRLLCLDGALTLLLAGDSQVVASTNSTRSRSRRVSRHEYERLRSTWRNDDDELLFFLWRQQKKQCARRLIDFSPSMTHTHTRIMSVVQSSTIGNIPVYVMATHVTHRNGKKEKAARCEARTRWRAATKWVVPNISIGSADCVCVCVCMDGPCTVPHSSFSSLSPDENMAGADYLADANDRSREPASRVKELLLRGGKKRVSRHLPSRRRRRDTLCPIVSVSLNSITLVVELLVSISFFLHLNYYYSDCTVCLNLREYENGRRPGSAGGEAKLSWFR